MDSGSFITPQELQNVIDFVKRLPKDWDRRGTLAVPAVSATLPRYLRGRHLFDCYPAVLDSAALRIRLRTLWPEQVFRDYGKVFDACGPFREGCVAENDLTGWLAKLPELRRAHRVCTARYEVDLMDITGQCLAYLFATARDLREEFEAQLDSVMARADGPSASLVCRHTRATLYGDCSMYLYSFIGSVEMAAWASVPEPAGVVAEEAAA
jgi:hypothetical protein